MVACAMLIRCDAVANDISLDRADVTSLLRADDVDPVGSTHITWSIFS